MNTKKISKIAWYSFLLFCASLLTCLGFHDAGQEKEKEIQIKADKIIAEKFDDEKVITTKERWIELIRKCLSAGLILKDLNFLFRFLVYHR